MSESTYKSIFDNIENLLDISPEINQVEWEVVGGETTMLPFEWWEKMLPWTFERIDQINKRFKDEGVVHYLTNLLYSDERYTGLFSEYGHHPLMCLYTSWEPDTGRFGKNNKLFDKFYSRLCSIDGHHKTLNILLSKSVLEIGPQPILDLFVPAGITDFSMQMIYPYGSGEVFFRENNPTYFDVSNFLIEFDTLKPREISFTPQEEFFSSLHGGAVTQWNGNSRYDLSFDMDGSITFNPNLTGTQSARPSEPIPLSDKSWPVRVALENKQEELKKHELPYDKCGACEYVNYCNGGWFLHKDTSQSNAIATDDVECSGLKMFWDYTKKTLGSSVADTVMLTHSKRVRDLFSRERFKSNSFRWIREEGFSSISDMASQCKKGERIKIYPGDIFNKPPIERIMLYVEIGMISFIESGFFDKILGSQCDFIADLILSKPGLFILESSFEIVNYCARHKTAFTKNIANIAGAVDFIESKSKTEEHIVEKFFNKGKYDQVCAIVSHLKSLDIDGVFPKLSIGDQDRLIISSALGAIDSEQCFVRSKYWG